MEFNNKWDNIRDEQKIELNSLSEKFQCKLDNNKIELNEQRVELSNLNEHFENKFARIIAKY